MSCDSYGGRAVLTPDWKRVEGGKGVIQGVRWYLWCGREAVICGTEDACRYSMYCRYWVVGD